MKKFIRNSFLFVFLYTVSVIITFPFLIGIISLNNSMFRIDKAKHILILGDSHTECGLNDAFIPGSINLSSSADAYLYSYLKLRKFISINPQINIIILGYGYHNLVKNMDAWYSGDKYIFEKLPKHIYLMKFSEIYNIFKSNPGSVLSSTLEIYRSIFKLMIKSVLHIQYKGLGLGRFLSLDYNKLEYDILRLMKKSPKESKQNEISRYQIKYILEINNLCKERKIKLILLSTPIYRYLSDQSKDGKEMIYNFYKSYLSGNNFWDYSNITLPNSYFGDCEHLNYNGATVFSKILKERLFNDLMTNSEINKNHSYKQ